MGIIWNGLAPHPPIIVASVGGDRCEDVRTTIASMEAFSSDLAAHKPQRLIVLSPHTPRPQLGIAAWKSGRIQGSFSQFGAPQTRIDLPVDEAWMVAFAHNYINISWLRNEQELDHGAMVPLYFAVQAGWDGPTCVLGLPWDEDGELDIIGDAIARASDDQVPTAMIASGDMSHCLKPGAPCGYNQRGGMFDNTFVDEVKRLAFRAATQIDPNLRDAARQDVLGSCRISWQATGYAHDHHQFYSYEGPFGVGYTVMKFYSEAPS